MIRQVCWDCKDIIESKDFESGTEKACPSCKSINHIATIVFETIRHDQMIYYKDGENKGKLTELGLKIRSEVLSKIIPLFSEYIMNNNACSRELSHLIIDCVKEIEYKS